MLVSIVKETLTMHQGAFIYGQGSNRVSEEVQGCAGWLHILAGQPSAWLMEDALKPSAAFH